MPRPLALILTSQAETTALADVLAGLLGAGDTVLLEGPIGAGKTALARALIHACQMRAGDPPEDVPSPTFTLVQTYAAGPLEIWHSDLYRLTHPDDVLELGLDDAFSTALCLVEWPDRLGSLAPRNALTLTLAPGRDDETRIATFSFSDPGWATRLTPALDMQVPDDQA